MGEAINIVNLFYCNAKLRKMTFLGSAFVIEKVVSQFIGIQYDLTSAIPAQNGSSLVGPRFAYQIPVSTIPTDEFKFEVHLFSETKQFFEW